MLRFIGVAMLNLVSVAFLALPASAQTIRASSVVTAASDDGRFEVFAIDAAGSIQHRWQMAGPVDWTS